MSLPVRSRRSDGPDWTNPLATFLVNQSLETTASRLEVETQSTAAGGAADLGPGVHRFRLVVVNDQGVESDPVIASISVTQPIIRPPIDTRVVVESQVEVTNPRLTERVVRSVRGDDSPIRPLQATKSDEELKSIKKPKPPPK